MTSITELSYDEKITQAIALIQEDSRLQDKLNELDAKVSSVALAFWCCTMKSTSAMYYVKTTDNQTIRILADYPKEGSIKLSLFDVLQTPPKV